jgi:hypothetical protein
MTSVGLEINDKVVEQRCAHHDTSEPLEAAGVGACTRACADRGPDMELLPRHGQGKVKVSIVWS